MQIFDLLNEKKIFDKEYEYQDKVVKQEFKYHKNLLYQNLKLVVTDLNNEIITTYNDVQPLYLYPLNILDYCSGLKDKKMVMANIYDYDKNVDYFSFILKNNLKAVEFTLTDELDENLLRDIAPNNIKILLNINNLNLDENLYKLVKYVDYIRIMLPSKFDLKQLEKILNIIKDNKSSDALFLIKTYLDLNMVDKYETLIDLFSSCSVNIFQVSKMLMPLQAKDNPSVSPKVQKVVRELEKKYSDIKKIKFISVKNIDQLYYERFEINENNSPQCFASFMKPYIFKDILMPCKVHEKITNINKWNYGTINDYDYNRISHMCGKCCDDCASLFENDLLYQVENHLIKDDVKFYLIADKEGEIHE